MIVWAIANQKGGVGKTTTTISLAGLLAQQGKRVLLVDLDPHASLTAYLGYQPDEIETGCYSLFIDEKSCIKPLINKTDFNQIDILCGSPALATLERQMGTRPGKGLILQHAIKTVESDYDYVLIDCPPILGLLMVNALAACNLLLIPVQTEFLAVKGLERMERTLAMINQSRKKSLPYIIVPTMFDRRTRASVKTLRVLRDHFTKNLWNKVIPIDTLFREASQAGQPLSFMEPKAKGVVAFQALLKSINTRKAG